MTTSPGNATLPRPSPISDPPRRAFGSFSKTPTNRPGSSSSTTSNTPTGSSTHLPLPIKPEANRTRSASSASSDAFASAADKAQAWLQTWAPKGEGRSREFLANTLNGVASVASTVSSGINGTVNNIGVQLSNESFGNHHRVGSHSNSRPTSFAGSPTESVNGSISRLGITSPGPTHTTSTALAGSQMVGSSTGRRIPQPSNLARLGANELASQSTGALNAQLQTSQLPPQTQPQALSHSRPSVSSPASSNTIPSIPRSTSTTLPHPRGPSHLGPNSRSISAHPSSTSPAAHTRTPSGSAPGPGLTSKSPSLSRSSSTTAGGAAGGLTRSAGMPYKIGFQPAGVKHDRTGEYMEARRRNGEERDKEEGRLGRRWAKLVDLHFNPTIPAPSPASGLTRSSSSSFSLSSKADRRSSLLSMDALDSLRPREVWKGLKGVAQPPGQGEEARKRAAEQALVKWEDDGEVRKCRICQSSFSLSNRKHHCRLCGRIVCSLPPTPAALLAIQVQLFAPADPSALSSPSSAMTQAALPSGTRREKCSLLLVADWKTGRGEEVEEGFVGWMKLQDEKGEAWDGMDGGSSNDKAGQVRREGRRSRSNLDGTNRIGSITTTTTAAAAAAEGGERGIPLPQQPREIQVKGVRACRECWAVVSRKQKVQDRHRANGFARLYQMLRSLQSEIEDLMPKFEDQMEELSGLDEPNEPQAEVLATHKSLLALLTQYEHVSKRLASLPVQEGGSQSQLQSAVARVSAGFLATEMVKVQALPRLQKAAAERRRNMTGVGLKGMVKEITLEEQLRAEGIGEEEAEDVAEALQPLLEQEAQLESYIADANAQRKYEDGKALTEALGEIRAEIARVTERAIR